MLAWQVAVSRAVMAVLPRLVLRRLPVAAGAAPQV
jgi:hypothetical protein